MALMDFVSGKACLGLRMAVTCWLFFLGHLLGHQAVWASKAPFDLKASEVSRERDFARLSSEVANALPTVAALHALGEEGVSRASQALLEAGAQLSKVARMLKENPELSRSGLNFYGKCASREELPLSIRGRCYSYVKGLARQAGQDRLASIPQVSLEVKKSASAVPLELDESPEPKSP